MKSIALLVWLLTPGGHEQIVERSHFDDMAACQARVGVVAGEYARQGLKTRHLCHVVIPENEAVDADGNPIEVPEPR